MLVGASLSVERSMDDESDDIDDQSQRMQPELDGGDVGLALEYLSDYRVIVLAHPMRRLTSSTRRASAAGMGSGAPLVVIVRSILTRDAVPNFPKASWCSSADVDAEATAPPFGRYAAAVDSGEETSIRHMPC